MINKRKEKWSEEKKLKFKRSYILGKRKDIDVNTLSKEEIEKLFHELKVESVNISQKKRLETLKNKCEKEKKKSAYQGALTRKINFLVKHDIINKDENLDKEVIESLFLKHFNKISKHGDKIIKGRKKKHGKNYKQSYTDSYKQAFLNYCKENNLDLSPETYDELYKKYCRRFPRNVDLWKKTHLINRNIKFTENNFNEKYNEYVRDRFNKLNDTLKNGYKRSKKGWYILPNNDKFFYRSSWELKVLKILSNLKEENIVEYIKIPERIMYYKDGYRHYYFPDIEYKLFNYDKKIIEIKPFSKLNENKIKLDCAKEEYGKDFIIITETDIYDDNLKNKLIEYGKI